MQECDLEAFVQSNKLSNTLTLIHSLCFGPLLQKSDHGQVLLDAVFKHLELTERDYFGLHLADDSSDAPVSVMFPIDSSDSED